LAIEHASRVLAKANASGETSDARLNARDEKQLAFDIKLGHTVLAGATRSRIEQRKAQGPVTEPVLPPAEERHTVCNADDKGAWAIVELAVEYVPGDEDWREPWRRNSRLGVARIDAKGKVSTAPVTTFLRPWRADDAERFSRGEMNCCSSIYGGEPHITFVGDLDKDGIPEVALAAGWGNEGDGEEWSALFRATPTGVQQLAEGFETVRDDTGDGLADLEYAERFSAGSACGSGFNLRETGPTFIAHNRGDGAFSRDDVEARAYARRWCPAPPTTFPTRDAVVCGALWRVPSKVISAWIEANVPPTEAGCDERGGNTELRNALSLSVPFTFEGDGGGSNGSPPHPG
jgi:hypothetical protein